MTAEAYNVIPAVAMERTFELLMQRPDCDPHKKARLLYGKQQFMSSGNKPEAMQLMLAEFPMDSYGNLVVETMTTLVKLLPQSAQATQAPAPVARPPQPANPQPAINLPPGLAIPNINPAHLMAAIAANPQLAANPTVATLLQHLRKAQATAATPAPNIAQQIGVKRTKPDTIDLTQDANKAGLAGTAGVSAAAAQAAISQPPIKQARPMAPPSSSAPLGALAPANTITAGGPGPGAGSAAQGEEDVTAEGIAETDTLAGAGVNLAAEQEALLQERAAKQTRTLKDVLPKYKEEHVVNAVPLTQLMRKAAARQGVSIVDPACTNYLALAIEAHVSRLLTSMARIAQQRTDPARQYTGVEPKGRNIAGRLKQLAGNTPSDNIVTSDTQQGSNNTNQPTTSSDTQTLLAFRKLRPLLAKQEADASASSIPLVRQIAPTDTLSTAEHSNPVALGLTDLIAALERDTVLSKHPVLWRLHQHLASNQ